MLYQLSSTEEHALYQVGVPSTSWHGFKLTDQIFTTSFSNRLQGIIRPFMQAVRGLAEKTGWNRTNRLADEG